MSKGQTPQKGEPKQQAKSSKPVKTQTQPNGKPVSETEKLFMSQPNMLLPRAVLHPEDPQERAWKYLSTTERQGLDSLDALAETLEDEKTVNDLRSTLENSGAFRLSAEADKENRIGSDDGLTEEERLQPWMQARKFHVRATAAPFYPAPRPPRRALLGHELAARARVRRTPERSRFRRTTKAQMVRWEAERGDGHGYEADLSQFIKVKRPKRKSAESQESQQALNLSDDEDSDGA